MPISPNERAIIHAQAKAFGVLLTLIEREGGPSLREFGRMLAIYATVAGEADSGGADLTEGDVLAAWAVYCEDAADERDSFKQHS